MQISNRTIRTLGLCATLAIFGSFSETGKLFAQTNVSLKAAPSIDMPSISASAGPSMPSITTPSIGSRYYTPKVNATYKTEESSSTKKSAAGLHTSDNTTLNNALIRASLGYNANASGAGNLSDLESLMNAELENGSSSGSLSANGTGTNGLGANGVGSSGVGARGKNTSTSDLLGGIQGLSGNRFSSYISAEDILAMSETGLVQNIYGRLGGQSNDTLLSTVLSELEQIKARLDAQDGGLNINHASNFSGNTNFSNNASLKRGAGTNQNSSENTKTHIIEEKNSSQYSKYNQALLSQNKNGKSSDNAKKDTILACRQTGGSGNPAILRFNVNGNDVLGSLRTVWFSNKENDGSFLVTGDRKYYADSKMRAETFYLLFKADGNGGSSMGYNVEPGVSQDFTNENSLFYKLTQAENLTATRTGNLVSLSTNSRDLSVNLLIDTGN